MAHRLPRLAVAWAVCAISTLGVACTPGGYEAELSVSALECEALGDRSYAWRVELDAEIVRSWDAAGQPEAFTDLGYSTSRGYGFVYELANWDCGDWAYEEIDDGSTLWAGCRWQEGSPEQTIIRVEHGIYATEVIETGIEVYADLRVYPGYRALAETASRTAQCPTP
jgi:hypothetical protein